MSFVKQYLELQSDEKLKAIVSLADKEVFEFGDKQYRFKKVSIQQYIELEQLFDEANSKQTPMEYLQALAVAYEKRALYFLGMSHDDFIAVAWEESRPVLDACMYRTIHGKPAFLGKLPTSSASVAKSSDSPSQPATS